MRSKIVLLFLVLIVSTCKDPFSPDVDPGNRDLLVVEGHLTIGGITTLTLSRTGELQERESRKPETNAKVEIEENNSVIAEGISGENGICSLLTQNLEISKKYRLRIIRTNGKGYETDYLESKTTPEIGDIKFEVEGKGFRIYLNTYDATNSTRFYSWNYTETWEIQSPYISHWELSGDKIIERDPNINMTRCWQENSSSDILLASTERLSENRVSHYPLAYVRANTIKLSHLYSILVKQYGLTRDAYEYLEKMKKNTQDIGTIFDPQPSELRGNIRCISNPKEPVIGWISAGTVSEKRIFIKLSDMPSGWGYTEQCEPVLQMHTDTVRIYLKKDFLITYRDIWAVPPPPPPWKLGDTSYTLVPRSCADCRLRGSNIKPSYWPE